MGETEWLPGPRAEHRVGLALSGGGIRSATFSAGILRTLSRATIMHRVDYLSTVSGGGYAGSFYCSLFLPGAIRGVYRDRPGAEVEEWCSKRAAALGPDPLGSNIGHDAAGQLRDGGNFLNPNGTSDTIFAAVVALRNWLGVAVVAGMGLLFLFLAIGSVRMIDDHAAVRNARLFFTDVAAAPAIGTKDAPSSVSPAVARRPSNEHRKSGQVKEQQLGSSWLWLLAAALVPLWTGPCTWAYWLTRTGRNIPRPRWRRPFSSAGLLALGSALACAAALKFGTHTGVWGALWVVLIASAVGGVVVYCAALWSNRAEEDEASGEGRRRNSAVAHAKEESSAIVAQENRVRAKLSRWLYRGVVCLLSVGALALIDDAGRSVYHALLGALGTDGEAITKTVLGAGWLSVIPIARWFLKRVQASDLLSWPRLGPVLRRFGRAIALVAGLLLLFVLATFWSAAAFGLIWQGRLVEVGGGEVTTWGGVLGSHWKPALLLTATAGVIALVLGRYHAFLNQSSLASFYAARLRKAYLGASNVDRIAARTPADIELLTDDIELEAYYHPGVLAPLHLINATVNETTSRSSRVIQRDRKGKSFTVSPAGYVFNEERPTDSPVAFKLDRGEPLPLSTWMGISGAAFSTGMGQHGSLGLSLLAGLSNMRLGYWWDSPYPGRRRERRGPRDSRDEPGLLTRLLRDRLDNLVQFYLLRELRGAFEGTHSNRWYLTDGGHYENMGVYELVRRRVRFIIACDNGADPSYAFGDLVNLIRKIRIDFEAETEFLSNEEMDVHLGRGTALRAAFGTLEDMIPVEDEQKGRTGPYATLARIRYQSLLDRAPNDGAEATPPSTLLLIKPRVTGGELPDLLRYKKANVAFPQQPTTDLFFDEAQWESYYRLGQLLGETIFADGPLEEAPSTPISDGRRLWRPFDLQPLPESGPPGSG